MSLPLQPATAPWSPQLLRATLLAVLVLAVLLVGMVAPARSAALRPLLDGPGGDHSYAREARRQIDAARQRVWLSMYVIRPDDGLVGALLEGLASAASRGVDVRVVLDRGRAWEGEPDRKHEAAAAWLQARGVRTLVDEEGVTTHAKLMVIDGRRILSGSHNWTRSALVANREVSWLIEDVDLARRIEEWFARIPGW